MSTTTSFITTTDYYDLDAVTLSDGYGYGFATSKILECAILCFLFIWLSYHAHSDLCTTERKSIAHCRKQPPLTSLYKQIIYVTLFAVCSLWLCEVVGIFYSVVHDKQSCNALVAASMSGYQIGKTLMYFLFLLRLRFVFGESQFAHSNRCFVLTVMLIGVLGVMNVIVSNTMISVEVVYYSDGKSFPNFCHALADDGATTFGSLLVFQDVFVASGFIIAYVIPLRKTIRAIERAAREMIISNEMVARVAYTGMKTTICTAVAVTSSVLAYAITLSGPFLRWIWAVDVVVNCVCLMLMTPYYPDRIYYQRLCRCCIACCDSSQYSHEEKQEEVSSKLSRTRTNPTGGVSGAIALQVDSQTGTELGTAVSDTVTVTDTSEVQLV